MINALVIVFAHITIAIIVTTNAQLTQPLLNVRTFQTFLVRLKIIGVTNQEANISWKNHLLTGG